METDLRLRVRLTRKLADTLNGVDVSKVQVGECLDLLPAAARALILEGWAELVDPTPVETPADKNDSESHDSTKTGPSNTEG